MNVVEPAKSSRSSCRSCNRKIEKGSTRLGVESEFELGGRTLTSLKWYHIDCSIKYLKDELISAEIISEIVISKKTGKTLTLSDEDIVKINKFKEKYNKSGMDVIGISDLTEGNQTVNIRATVNRKMNSKPLINLENEESEASTVYVKDEGVNGKIILWEEHADLQMEKDDEIIVLKGLTSLASNDSIEVNVTSKSQVLINPSQEELSKFSQGVKLYLSNAWKRPTGKPAEFQYAPSGRADCAFCEKIISKGELKIVKPDFIEIPNGRTIPGYTSYHILCINSDDVGGEVLKEAITRLTIDLAEDNKIALENMIKNIDNEEIKHLLDSILQ